VLAARDRLLTALRDAGYPLARVTLPPATLYPAQHKMDVAFVADTGPHADLGQIRFEGLKRMSESFMRERLLLHPGQAFNPPAIERAREDLMSVGVFSSVRIIPSDRLDPQGNLPLTVDVTERPLHAVSLGAAYSTDLGAMFNASWRHRNLFGGAEQLNLTGSVQMGGSALTKPGYQAGIQFIKPDFLQRDQSLDLSVNAVKQSLQAYDQTALIERATLSRKLSKNWTVSIGLLGEQETITQEGTTDTYHLLGVPVTAKYDSTNSPFDPTHGIRATLSIMPMQSLGANKGTFVISQAAASTYLDLLSDGRSVLAMRGLIGQASGVGVFGLPPDQRFYAGGSGTVRGYRYQSIGPQFPSGNPTGGNAVAAGTIEFRQRILDKYGVVAFIDTGQVSNDGKPFSGAWHAGAGVGARYYTPIGPIRLDVAVPLNRPPGGDSFELYIGIGQAF
ncbi:MAG: autotransporter assembly complex family protein, partial [Acetobacteraceae bacterium]